MDRYIPLNLPDVPAVTVDTETSGLFIDDGARVASVIVGWRQENELEIRYLPFDQGRLEQKMPFFQRSLLEDGRDANLGRGQWEELLEWLSGRELLVMHHAKFDLHMLRVGTREWEGKELIGNQIWCTQLAAKELDPLEPVALDAVGERLGLGGKQGKDAVWDWLKARGFDKGRYDLVPIDIMERYATRDVELTHPIYELQRSEVWGRELLDQVLRKFDVMKVLYKMEQRGIPYDVGKSMEIADQLEKEIARIEKTRPFGPKLNEARKWFFDLQRGTVLRRTPTGAESLDEECVRSLIREGISWAREYAEVASLKTAASMWYRGYAEKAGHDGRLRTSYRQTKVVSNRMSVERIQLQAIPKVNVKVEKLCGPGTSVRALIKGETPLWNLDLQQAELRVAAKYSRCTKMLDMLQDGTDFHSETTKRVFGMDGSEPDFKLKRDIGKRLTFASIFQIGGEAMQEQLASKADIRLELAECEKMVRRWRAEYPEFGVAYQRAEMRVRERGYVKLLPKTKYESRSYYAKHEKENTGWSRMVQGSLAEALQLWLVAAERAVKGVMVLTVHDSVVLETDDREKVAEVVAIGETLLTKLFGVEMKVGAERWSY